MLLVFLQGNMIGGVIYTTMAVVVVVMIVVNRCNQQQLR